MENPKETKKLIQRIGKTGNGYAIYIPTDYMAALGLQDGDSVEFDLKRVDDAVVAQQPAVFISKAARRAAQRRLQQAQLDKFKKKKLNADARQVKAVLRFIRVVCRASDGGDSVAVPLTTQ